MEGIRRAINVFHVIMFVYICRFAFVEFADQASVPLALQYNGAMLGDRPIKCVCVCVCVCVPFSSVKNKFVLYRLQVVSHLVLFAFYSLLKFTACAMQG